MLLLLATSCAADAGDERAAPARRGDGGAPPRRLIVEVRASYPHDPEAWTQGLLWHDGALYESLGLFARSRLRRVRLETGEVELETALPGEVFAEGLALQDGFLYQLTWHAGRGFRWAAGDLAPGAEFGYEGEGWGLCAAGGELVRSSGSSRLTFHRAEDVLALRTLEVTRDGRPQTHLNELECVDGWIYANVWMTDEIVRIDPATGRVTAVIDASGLLSPAEAARADVLNGIAYYPPNRSFLLTGKNWPRLFEVSFVER